jgi:hypothetical protein
MPLLFACRPIQSRIKCFQVFHSVHSQIIKHPFNYTDQRMCTFGRDWPVTANCTPTFKIQKILTLDYQGF